MIHLLTTSFLDFHCARNGEVDSLLSTPIGSNMGPQANTVTDIIRFGRRASACGTNCEEGAKRGGNDDGKGDNKT